MTQSSQDKKTQVQEYFSRTAEGYVTSFSHRGGEDAPDSNRRLAT